MKAKVMPDGRVSLPADLRKRHGLSQGLSQTRMR